MVKKNCRKFQLDEQGARTLQTTDSQTTDGRAIAYRSLKTRLFNDADFTVVITITEQFLILLPLA